VVETPVAVASLGQTARLWVPPPIRPRSGGRLERWIEGITEEIQATGRPEADARTRRRGRRQRDGHGRDARHVHPHGRSHGRELGVAAATAFLNQKVLAALFGEAAMVRARRRTRSSDSTRRCPRLRRGAGRFDAPPAGSWRPDDLAADLRAAAADVRALPEPDLMDPTGGSRPRRSRMRMTPSCRCLASLLQAIEAADVLGIPPRRHARCTPTASDASVSRPMPTCSHWSGARVWASRACSTRWPARR
jgi:hypothetical protein